MRNQAVRAGLTLCVFVIAMAATAQTIPGTIIRAATSTAGRTVLDPNTTYNFPGNTSRFSTGFGSDDVGNSEIAFKPIPALSFEPFADLRRGPSHRFSDFVPDSGDDGVYAYFDNTNLLFRFRMGSIMSGSKGYSILLDTDGKFGATGAAADPDYQPATTGTNGNPGFEIEIVLETNFKIGIYNVNGTSSPVLIKSYTNWQEYSQISVAGTNDNGDPDFYMDFFIPFSDLQAAPFNLTLATSIRISATTVMAPKPAIGGPKSDIYGVNDDTYQNANDAYEAFIRGQCSFLLSGLQSPAQCPVCTEPPVLNAPLSVGTVSISGTWVKSTLAGSLGVARITVYKNGTTLLGTVDDVPSGASWQLDNIALTGTDVITARAQATGESMCHVSNSVTPTICNTATRPAKPVLTCITTGSDFNKGVTGNNLSAGWVVYMENMTRSTIENSTANAAQFTFSGSSPAMTWNYAGGCSGGPNMPSGSYKVYYTNAAGCISEPVFFCVSGNGGSALGGTTVVPVITAPANSITTATTAITGSGEPNSTVALFVNGTSLQSVTASNTGAFTFPGLSLLAGQQLYISNILTGGTAAASKCLSATATYTVTCNTAAPLITTDAANTLAIGAPVTGVSSRAGDIVRIYLSPSTLVATTTAGGNGLWSTSAAGTSPAPYNAVAGSYFATAQSGSCGTSANSAAIPAIAPTPTARCGTISGPVTAAASSISGTLTGSFATTTVNLYIDGTLLGSTTTSNGAWGPIAVNTADKNTTLYPNAVLTIGVQESGKGEALCASSDMAIECTPLPTAPVISPTTSTTTQNGTVTYTISNAVTGTFYALAEAVSGASLGTGIWASTDGNLTITTKPLPSSRTYNVQVKATSINGIDVCTSLPGAATINVSGILPLRSIQLTGRRERGNVLLQWDTEGEKDVQHFVVERGLEGGAFGAIGTTVAKGGNFSHTYQYTDANASTGTTYYRLKIVDNGLNNYSNTIKVRGEGNIETEIGPNPFTNRLLISFTSVDAERMDVQLSSAEGKVVRSISIQLQRGANTFTIDGLQDLAPGMYFITLKVGGVPLQQKLMKLR